MFRTMLLLLLAVGQVAFGQLVSGRFTTSFYGWQGRDEDQNKRNYARFYENVKFDLANQQYSFSTNFQTSKDFGSTISTDPELRLSTLVLKARDLFNVLDIKVGRQFIYAGVGNGLMDGAEIKAHSSISNIGIAAILFGGYNVIHSRNIDLGRAFADNCLYGGQVIVEPIEDGTFGFSYVNRTRKPAPFRVLRADSLFNPYVIIIAHSPVEEEYASVDARYALGSLLDIYARSDFDFHFERISRLQTHARVEIIDGLGFSVDYLFREPRVNFNSIFSVFNVNSTKEIEGGIDYEIADGFRTYARYAVVNYVDDKSHRMTIGGAYRILQFSYTKNFGYAGDLNGISLQAVYPMFDRKVIPNMGLSFATFQESTEDITSTVFARTLGVTYRPTPALSADVQLQWLSNRLYRNDGRVFIKIGYWFNERVSWL